MKKILTLIAVVGLVVFSSCEGPEGPPGADALTPEAFEIKNVDLARVTNREYKISGTFQDEVGGPLFDDETVLVYRLTGTLNATTPIWQLIPRSTHFDNGDVLEYDFDFSKVDFTITAWGNYDLLNRSEFVDDQTFRVVIIPSDLAATVNKNNYLEVMKAAKLSDSQIQQIKM